MLAQLLINNDFEIMMSLSIIVMSVFLSAITIVIGASAVLNDDDHFIGLVCLAVATIGISGAYVSIQQLNKQVDEIKTVKQGHIEDYYNLTKDGKAIKFTLKDDKSDLLQKHAEARIIDEDNQTYQIQYKDTIDRVPKSAVK